VAETPSTSVAGIFVGHPDVPAGGSAGLVHDREPQPTQRRVGALGQPSPQRRTVVVGPSTPPAAWPAPPAVRSNSGCYPIGLRAPPTSASATSSHTRPGMVAGPPWGRGLSAISSSRTRSTYRPGIWPQIAQALVPAELWFPRRVGHTRHGRRPTPISSVRKPRSHPLISRTWNFGSGGGATGQLMRDGGPLQRERSRVARAPQPALGRVQPQICSPDVCTRRTPLPTVRRLRWTNPLTEPRSNAIAPPSGRSTLAPTARHVPALGSSSA